MIDAKFLKQRLEARYYPHKFRVVETGDHKIYIRKGKMGCLFDLEVWTSEDEIIEIFEIFEHDIRLKDMVLDG